MESRGRRDIVVPVKPSDEHHQLCTIELIAEGHAERCPGEGCPFWERGCALTRIEYELNGRPEVAKLLLDLRRELEAGRAVEIEEARSRFAHILNEDDGIAETSAGRGAGVVESAIGRQARAAAWSTERSLSSRRDMCTHGSAFSR